MSVTIRLATQEDAQVITHIHTSSWEVAYKDIIPEKYIKEKNAT